MLQTLTLWSEISTDMFRLWCLAEDDMLRESNGYRWVVGTGQGCMYTHCVCARARACCVCTCACVSECAWCVYEVLDTHC